jgi:nucleotide-binding universal stress UspA family protein
VFKHILVPTDLTEKSAMALHIAAKMAMSEGGLLTLLHVIEVIADAEGDEFENFYEKLRKRAYKQMKEIAEKYENEKLKIDKKIVFGDRVREIITYAQDNDIDLIVLSSHKIDRTNPAEGWGTISYKVGILSHCPVMMVK